MTQSKEIFLFWGDPPGLPHFSLSWTDMQRGTLQGERSVTHSILFSALPENIGDMLIVSSSNVLSDFQITSLLHQFFCVRINYLLKYVLM